MITKNSKDNVKIQIYSLRKKAAGAAFYDLDIQQ